MSDKKQITWRTFIQYCTARFWGERQRKQLCYYIIKPNCEHGLCRPKNCPVWKRLRDVPTEKGDSDNG